MMAGNSSAKRFGDAQQGNNNRSDAIEGIYLGSRISVSANVISDGDICRCSQKIKIRKRC